MAFMSPANPHVRHALTFCAGLAVGAVLMLLYVIAGLMWLARDAHTDPRSGRDI